MPLYTTCTVLLGVIRSNYFLKVVLRCTSPYFRFYRKMLLSTSCTASAVQACIAVPRSTFTRVRRLYDPRKSLQNELTFDIHRAYVTCSLSGGKLLFGLRKIDLKTFYTRDNNIVIINNNKRRSGRRNHGIYGRTVVGELVAQHDLSLPSNWNDYSTTRTRTSNTVPRFARSQ